MIGIVHVLVAMIIFHEEAKYILIRNSILNQVLVQAVAEDFFCSMTVNGILYENRCASKAENLRVVEELDDVLMAITEMAAVALIENHHDA